SFMSRRHPHATLFPYTTLFRSRRDELDFSFSGLKTSLRYQLEKMTPDEIAARRADLCASYQQAVIDALVRKAGAALRLGKYRSLGLSGGVANNQPLRAALGGLAKKHRLPLLAAEPRHTGDNAAMIAFAAWEIGRASWRGSRRFSVDGGGTTANRQATH